MTNNNKRVIIIGGVAGGASAAARLRRTDETAQILMIERGPYVSFANCGLPYHVGEVIKERDKLILVDPQTFKDRFNIDVRIQTEVISINRDDKTIMTKNTVTDEISTECYDILVLSPGAKPFVPPIENLESVNYHVLRNIPDMDAIKKVVDEKHPNHAVVVGSGFIGLEIAENLRHRGIDVTLVEMLDHVLATVDTDTARLIHPEIEKNGIELLLSTQVTAVEKDNEKIVVKTDSGQHIPTDLLILSVGVRPESELAQSAGLECGPRGTIKVNGKMQTSDPSIYAVGDVVEVACLINNEKTHIPLAGPANKQGRIVANVISGRDDFYKGSIATSVLKVFNLTVATTGLTEHALKQSGIVYEKSFTHSASHAGYYPGSSPMTIKLIFSPDGKNILGAQIVGRDGVDKRIDVIATALGLGASVNDLTHLELAYAPPYSSAKDPVNMAGYVAGNIVIGDMAIKHWHDVSAIVSNNDWVILDVRTSIENSCGAIQQSINIPVNELRSRLNEIPKNKNVLVYCQVGLRAWIAYQILRQNGFEKVYNLSGGYKTFSSATLTQQSKFAQEMVCKEKISSDDMITKEHIAKKTQLEKTRTEIVVDATGLQCPGPLMSLAQAAKGAKPGDMIKIKATDPGFANDVYSWAQTTGNNVVDLVDGNTIDATIQIGGGTTYSDSAIVNDGKTMVIFSNDFDKALAAFVIANGAVAMGKPTTMFFTFWGLNILRRHNSPPVSKPFIDRMFGLMMPKGAKKLALSKMHFFGPGTAFMKHRMDKKNIDSLEKMIDSAKAAGVRLIACQMSMDMMGIKKDELIDGVEISGVATFIEATDKSNTTLFI